MSGSRRRKPAARSNARRQQSTGRDFWGTEVAEEHVVEPITPADDPTALIVSLGPPPLASREMAPYPSAVVYKAAQAAKALAAASGLLHDEENKEPE